MKLLLYCTKAKPILRDYRGKAIYNRFVISPTDRPFTSDDTQPILNGKIVAECDFEVEEIKYFDDDFGEGELYTETLNIEELEERSCVGRNDLSFYLANKYSYKGYAIHIKNLHIFDKPKELNEYYGLIPKKVNTLNGSCYINESIDNAPQNMMYAIDDNDNEYVLISIQPQWLCKILNGEKTIEVRKQVLKEMIK